MYVSEGNNVMTESIHKKWEQCSRQKLHSHNKRAKQEIHCTRQGSATEVQYGKRRLQIWPTKNVSVRCKLEKS